MKRCLIFLSVVAVVVAEVDYCARSCHINGTEVKHIACNNTGEFSPDCGPDASMVEMNESFKNLILLEFNSLRNFVAGGAGGIYKNKYKPACRMATMQWDDELAKNSVLFSKRCKYEGDNCHGTDVFPNSGHLLMPSNQHSKNISAIEAFQDLFSWFRYAVLESGSIDMFADRNIRLGCSAVLTNWQDDDDDDDDDDVGFQFNCFYSVNLHECDTMYTECETAATGCKKRNTRFPNLCSVDEVYEH